MRYADDYFRLGKGGALVNFADEMLDHFLCDIKISNDTVSHWANGLNGTGCPAEHELGILTKGQRFFLTILDLIGHDGRFI